MSAHCEVCGFDLPYMGECSYCTLKAELAAERALRVQAQRERVEAAACAGRWLTKAEQAGARVSELEQALREIAEGRWNVVEFAREALAVAETKEPT